MKFKEIVAVIFGAGVGVAVHGMTQNLLDSIDGPALWPRFAAAGIAAVLFAVSFYDLWYIGPVRSISSGCFGVFITVSGASSGLFVFIHQFGTFVYHTDLMMLFLSAIMFFGSLIVFGLIFLAQDPQNDKRGHVGRYVWNLTRR